jgi:hypothetical protein
VGYEGLASTILKIDLSQRPRLMRANGTMVDEM